MDCRLSARTVSCSAQLSLSDNKIDDAGAAELAKALVDDRTLTMVTCLHRKPPPLLLLPSVQFSLCSNCVGASGAAALTNELAADSVLPELVTRSEADGGGVADEAKEGEARYHRDGRSLEWLCVVALLWGHE